MRLLAALGNMLSKANMQIFGDPETMAKMSQRFMAAASFGAAALPRSLSREPRKTLQPSFPSLRAVS